MRDWFETLLFLLLAFVGMLFLGCLAIELLGDKCCGL
jgi:hypothetical protein